MFVTPPPAEKGERETLRLPPSFPPSLAPTPQREKSFRLKAIFSWTILKSSGPLTKALLSLVNLHNDRLHPARRQVFLVKSLQKMTQTFFRPQWTHRCKIVSQLPRCPLFCFVGKNSRVKEKKRNSRAAFDSWEHLLSLVSILCVVRRQLCKAPLCFRTSPWRDLSSPQHSKYTRPLLPWSLG